VISIFKILDGFLKKMHLGALRFIGDHGKIFACLNACVILFLQAQDLQGVESKMPSLLELVRGTPSKREEHTTS